MIAVYLGKVDLHNSKSWNVKFEESEIKNILGVDNIEEDVLNKKSDGLVQ